MILLMVLALGGHGEHADRCDSQGYLHTQRAREDG